jgi:hypothetical protein
MKFNEIIEDKGSTLASRVIRNYARELGADSMDYGMFIKSADLLDKDMLKSLALHIEKSDTAPREYVMKKIADHNPEIFKKMYGDQEGYLSLMKPAQDLTDGEDNTDRGMNKYGLAARNKDGKFYSYRHGKLTGTFNNIEDLQRHQQELIKDESVQEDGMTSADVDRVRNQSFSDKQIKMAFGILNDPRYRGGNYTGAYNTINKIAPGLANHPSVANALRKANEELNRITKLAGLGEGASMLPYYKDPKDEKQMTWTFPDAWQKDEALDTPYMSNMSMRQFLDALGYDPNFEDQSPVPAKEFIARTTQWLQKNIDKPSAEIPATVDQNPGGPTMYSGGREEGHMNRVVKGHNELARKILAKYPEVTHFGFN